MMEAEEMQRKRLNASKNRGPFLNLTVNPGKLWCHKKLQKMLYSSNATTSLPITGGPLSDQTKTDVQVKYDLAENSLKSAS